MANETAKTIIQHEGKIDDFRDSTGLDWTKNIASIDQNISKLHTPRMREVDNDTVKGKLFLAHNIDDLEIVSNDVPSPRDKKRNSYRDMSIDPNVTSYCSLTL